MSLFNFGAFKLHSGKFVDFKIDCDFLSIDDIISVTRMMVGVLNIKYSIKFKEVYGVPTGGERLARCLKSFTNLDGVYTLLVDDVWTTGDSLRTFIKDKNIQGPRVGFVIFSRGSLPDNVFSLFDYNIDPYVERLPKNI